MARYLGLACNPAPAASFSSVVAARVFYLVDECDSAAAARYARAVFQSQHTLACSPNSWAQCVALAQQVGVEPAWLVGPEQTERGREMFLGCDRIAQLD